MALINPHTVQAIIFDWGGVCCKAGEPFASAALQKALSMNPDTIAEHVRTIHDEYYKGNLDSAAFWGFVINHFQLTENADINPTALSQAYLSSYTIYPEVLDAASRLRGLYQVALLSNLTPEMRDHIKKEYQTEKYFAPELYSCDKEVRAMKPAPKPFTIMLAKLDIDARNCLFVDDSEKNIKAAEHLGFQTIPVQSPQQLLEDLKPFLH